MFKIKKPAHHLKKLIPKRTLRKFSRTLSRWNSKFHLKYVCKKCPLEKRLTRDLHGIGECFWYHSWSNGRYDIPGWMGTKNFFRVKFKKKPLVMKINNEILYGKAPIIKRRKYSRFFVKSVSILRKIPYPKRFKK